MRQSMKVDFKARQHLAVWMASGHTSQTRSMTRLKATTKPAIEVRRKKQLDIQVSHHHLLKRLSSL
jgi:hypothetical protein